MTEAQVKMIDNVSHNFTHPIEIRWNFLTVEVIQASRFQAKYKKVTLESKLALFALVKEGSSIVNAAKALNINYSTAKSIFQNLKARAAGKYKRKRIVPADLDSYSETVKGQDNQYT